MATASGSDDGEWTTKVNHKSKTSQSLDKEISVLVRRLSEYENIFGATTYRSGQTVLTPDQEALVTVSKLITGNEVCGAAYIDRRGSLLLSNNTERHDMIESMKPLLRDIARGAEPEAMIDHVWARGMNYHSKAIGSQLLQELQAARIEVPALRAYMISYNEQGKSHESTRGLLPEAAAEIDAIRRSEPPNQLAMRAIERAYDHEIENDVRFLSTYVGRNPASALATSLATGNIQTRSGEARVHAEMKMEEPARDYGGFIATPKKPCFTCFTYLTAIDPPENPIVVMNSHGKTYNLEVPKHFTEVEKTKVRDSLQASIAVFETAEADIRRRHKDSPPQLTKRFLQERRENPQRFGLFPMGSDEVVLTRSLDAREERERAVAPTPPHREQDRVSDARTAGHAAAPRSSAQDPLDQTRGAQPHQFGNPTNLGRGRGRGRGGGSGRGIERPW